MKRFLFLILHSKFEILHSASNKNAAFRRRFFPEAKEIYFEDLLAGAAAVLTVPLTGTVTIGFTLSLV
jgi:hypothetical protein